MKRLDSFENAMNVLSFHIILRISSWWLSWLLLKVRTLLFTWKFNEHCNFFVMSYRDQVING